jgi:hypothetical protein
VEVDLDGLGGDGMPPGFLEVLDTVVTVNIASLPKKPLAAGVPPTRSTALHHGIDLAPVQSLNLITLIILTKQRT